MDILSDDEKLERCKKHYKEDRQFWSAYSTKDLFEEIRDDLHGCVDPYCLTCGNRDALVDELKTRFKIEIEKAIARD